MADVKELTVGGTTYKIKDEVCRTNILYVLEKIGTNLIKPRDDLPTVVTALPEGIRIQRSNTTSSFAYVECGKVYLESGKKYVLYDATYSPTTKHHYFYVDCGGNGFVELSTPSITATVQYGTGRTTGTYKIYTRIDANSTVDTISTPIICLESAWKQLASYTPYGAPNYDLTRLESEDRAGLVEEIDSGAKNKGDFQFGGVNPDQSISAGNITYTVSNGQFTFNGSADASKNYACYLLTKKTIKAGNYIISGCTGGSSTTYRMRVGSGSSDTFLFNVTTEPVELNLTTDTVITVQFVVQANTSVSNLKISPMICTKAAFGVSSAFVPYKYPSPTSIALQTESFNVAAANTYYKIFERFVGGDNVNRLYKIAAAAMYAGARPTALKVTTQAQTAGSSETIAREITSESDINFLSTDYIWRSYGGTIRVYASYKAVTNKGAAYLIIDQYKV